MPISKREVERFTLGTLAVYPEAGHDAAILPGVLDERTGSTYRFLSWDGAREAIAAMRAEPDGHPFFPTREAAAFTPAAHGVDVGRAS